MDEPGFEPGVSPQPMGCDTELRHSPKTILSFKLSLKKDKLLI